VLPVLALQKIAGPNIMPASPDLTGEVCANKTPAAAEKYPLLSHDYLSELAMLVSFLGPGLDRLAGKGIEDLMEEVFLLKVIYPVLGESF